MQNLVQAAFGGAVLSLSFELRVMRSLSAKRRDPSRPRRSFESDGSRAVLRQRASGAAVLGSITRFTSVTLLAGKPLISACFLISAGSVAR
jgi:hypothetical protein